MLGYIVAASLIISAVSLIGIFTLSMKTGLLNRLLLVLVAIAAGTMIGNVFFHLLPESIEMLPARTAFIMVLISFVIFFFIEKVLRWHHCHRHDCEKHTVGYMNLIGDAVHNFTDGLIIAASFIVSIPLGVATTIAIAFHEIPQEIGDFGVLLHSGFSRKKALFMNFLVALGSLAGAVSGYFLIQNIAIVEAYLIPFAAGGFLYIAASDLLPELREEENFQKIALHAFAFVIGISFMYLLEVNGHAHRVHNEDEVDGHLQEKLHDDEQEYEEESLDRLHRTDPHIIDSSHAE